MSLVRKFLRNTIYIVFSNIFIKVINFIFLLVATQKLTDANFGKFGTVNTVVFIFTMFSNLGFQPMSIKELSRNRDNKRFIFLNIITIRMIMALIGLIIYLVMVIFVFSYEHDVIVFMLIVSVTIIINAMINSMSTMFIAFEKMDIPAFLGVLIAILFNVSSISFLLLMGDGGLRYLFIMQVFSAVLGFSFYYKYFKKHFFPIRPLLDRKYALEILGRTLPFGILTFLIVINSRIDQFMLSIIPGGVELNFEKIGLDAAPITMSAVAFYTIPFRLFDSLAMMLDSVRTVIYPSISVNFEKNREMVINTFRRLLRWIISLYSIPVLFAAIVGANSIIVLFFSEKYAPSAIAMKIQAGTYAVNGLNMIVLPVLFNSKYVVKTGGAVLLILLSTFAIILNASLNYYLIPKYSYVGAAWATLASVIFMMSIKLILIKRTFMENRGLFKVVDYRLIFASGTMVLSYYLLRNYLFVSSENLFHNLIAVAVSVIFYYVSIFMFGVVPDDEKEYLKTIVLKVAGFRRS